MRELVLKMSMSLDGFVAAPADRAGSTWMFQGSTPDSAAWVRDTIAGAGTHAVGRRLFESWIAFWPTSDSPMAAPVNDISKVVFTRDPGFDPSALAASIADPAMRAKWDGSRVAGGSLATEIERLKAESGRYVLAQGGVAFCRSLVLAGLVDEYRFAVMPIVLGAGERLFDGLTEDLPLDLVSATAFRGGAVGSVYRPVR